MNIDFNTIDSGRRYKLLVSCLVPRPIALVTTVGLDGRINAAPFSFFNAISDDPPAVAIGVNSSVTSRTKDTAQNIRETGELVVNLVDEPMSSQMNRCAVDFAPTVNELQATGLTARPSVQVKAPRVFESPISFECRRLATVEIGLGRNIIIAQVVHLHVEDSLIDEHLHIRGHDSGLIARMHGSGWYARTTDLFHMSRATDDVEPRTDDACEGENPKC